jgi:phospholipase C
MRPWTVVHTSLGACAIVLAGCGGGQSPVAPQVPQLPSAARPAPQAAREIQHVIVVIQADRSFDNLFAGFPNADAPTTGLESNGKRVPLRPISFKTQTYCGGNGADFARIYDGAKMDGWNLVDPRDPRCPYTRVERRQTRPYWDLAQSYAIADHMFPSTRFGDFPAQLYLVAATSKIDPRTFIAGEPDNTPWGCDAPAGTQTPILKDGRMEADGPFPCFDQFPTIANLLDKARVSWKYYEGLRFATIFAAIEYVRSGRDWTRNMSYPATNFFADIAQGKLSAVSWIVSPPQDSDMPGFDDGPHWIDSIVEATQKSRYWAHAAIVVVWQTAGSGNFYDNVAPPQLTEVGLGFRVPMLVVSPYAKRHEVSHTTYQFGSILKFIEQNWKLGTLGATDEHSNSIGDIFNFGG